LVIIDINLGEHRTGVDVLQHVRATRGDEVPVLALTAYALPGDREQYLAVGFDAYLSKPFSSEQLRKYISDLLGA
ncbi:MAG: response regulator, partial [Rhodothermales bacterium]